MSTTSRTGNTRLTWYGEEMKKRIRDISEDAVRDTAEKAADAARGDHGWQNRTGALEAGIGGVEVARVKDGVVGSFGYSESYGLFQEIGFRGRPGDHTLRRAGDREFSELADRIERDF